jgi:hypothetical protein
MVENMVSKGIEASLFHIILAVLAFIGIAAIIFLSFGGVRGALGSFACDLLLHLKDLTGVAGHLIPTFNCPGG